MKLVIKINRTLLVLFTVITFLRCAEIVFADNKGIVKEKKLSGKSHNRKFLCCARHEKIINIGHDISGDVIEFDVGQCRKLCPRDVFYDPGDRSKPAVQKCTQNRHCRPRSAKIERISAVEGVREMMNIEMCECSAPHYCRRRRFNYLLYAGTPHQTNVDVGLCLGYCNQDLGCKPVKNHTVTIKGPNGNELHQIIDKCGCTNRCYRVDHIETILDYSGIQLYDGVSDIRAIVSRINVGKCIGSCETNTTETCILRDKRDPLKCFSSYTNQGHCVPVKFEVHEYRTRRGSKREIIKISECACV